MSRRVSLSGKDTIMIDGRVIRDLADGDSTLEFNEDLMKAKRGKEGNVVYALNEMGAMADLTLRIVLGSDDDKYLNGRLLEMQADPSSFILLTGSFAKRVGDGQGNQATVVYQGAGGVFKRVPNVLSSAEGNTDQGVAVYTITYGNAPRSVQ